MVNLDKTRRDLFIMDFVQFVSAPQTSAKRLRKWNATVKQCPGNMAEEEWMRLWRGVYYIVWYEEMRKGGEEFITHIAEWSSPSFILSGFKSMAEFWGGIDAFRIDKYMFLARKMLQNLFKLLQNDEIVADFRQQQILVDYIESSEKKDLVETKLNELVAKFSTHVVDYILTVSATSVGFSMHLFDMFVDELQAAVPSILNQAVFMIPFLKRLALVDDERLRNGLKSKVFFPFISTTLGMDSSPQVISFVEELMKLATSFASGTTKGKNRAALYELAEFCKTSMDRNRKTREGKMPLKMKPTKFNRRERRFRYEARSSIMYPKSLKPIAFDCDS